MISKELLIEAWSKYRPSTTEHTPRGPGVDKDAKGIKKKDMNEIYGQQFLDKLFQKMDKN